MRKFKMIPTLITLLASAVLLLHPATGLHGERSKDPDVGLTVPELIIRYGYPEETHYVTTKDNYELAIHRIPYGRGQSPDTDRPVVFLQHGLTASSACWLLNGVENSLAFILADAGYDVWLGNARGNVYSRLKTQQHDPDTNDYWKFSWHEGGVYDLPAAIDHILDKTGQEKIFYVGHSMGTTMFYVMTSELPEYNDKIHAMASLAPIAFMSHIGNIFLKLLSPASSELQWLMDLIGMYEFLPQNDLFTILGQALCNEDAVFKELCDNIAFLLLGFDSHHLNVSRIPVYLSNEPQGCSTEMWVHYGQEVASGHFRQFDYGWANNLIHYGNIAPPDYDLSKITAPTKLFYGDNDKMASVTDVMELQTRLPNSLGLFPVKQSGFTHMDFLLHTEARSLVYEPILQIFESIKQT